MSRAWAVPTKEQDLNIPIKHNTNNRHTLSTL